jgi:hypothetical protein
MTRAYVLKHVVSTPKAYRVHRVMLKARAAANAAWIAAASAAGSAAASAMACVAHLGGAGGGRFVDLSVLSVDSFGGRHGPAVGLITMWFRQAGQEAGEGRGLI